MKLTKDILDKAMINAGIPSEKAAVLYNWEEPADLTSSEYSSAINTYTSLLFNNAKLGKDHFYDQDITGGGLLVEALPGLSVGSTDNALTNTGVGQFAGTDLIRISNEIN